MFFFFFFPSLPFSSCFCCFWRCRLKFPPRDNPNQHIKKRCTGQPGKRKRKKKKMSKNSRRAWRPWSRFVNSWRWVRCIAWVSRVPMTVVPVRSFFFLSLFFGYCCCCCSLFFLDLYNIRYISCQKRTSRNSFVCVGGGGDIGPCPVYERISSPSHAEVRLMIIKGARVWCNISVLALERRPVTPRPHTQTSMGSPARRLTRDPSTRKWEM